MGDGHWQAYIDKKDKEVFSVSEFNRDDLDELSDVEIRVAKTVYDSFGWMTPSRIRKYTHNNCPEYTEVKSGRLPISYKEMMEALNIPDAELLADQINETRRVEHLLSA